MTGKIVLNDAVRNTDKFNIIKMTREILEIVGDNIDTNRIMLVTKINNRIPRVTVVIPIVLPYYSNYLYSILNLLCIL